MPAKISETTTLMWARPPRKWPTIVFVKSTRRSVMPAEFMTLAASRKKGTASRMKASYALAISVMSSTGVMRSSRMKMGRQARPSAKETGTRRMTSTAKAPNMMVAAVSALMPTARAGWRPPPPSSR